MESNQQLPQQLKDLVKMSVSLLGQVIEQELGPGTYREIELVRQRMAELRKMSASESFSQLMNLYRSFEKLKPNKRIEIARAFALMLELMNACENAYRSYRLSSKQYVSKGEAHRPKAIIYVLTAHPTEARSPQNIEIFHQIQSVLIQRLCGSEDREALVHLLKIAWHVSVVRNRAPKVKDEAEHIYSLLLRDDVLFSLIDARADKVPFYVRTWVGGDKDGHPGVDEKVLFASLSLSRQELVKVFLRQIKDVRRTLALFPSISLQGELTQIEKKIRNLRSLRARDANKIRLLRAHLQKFIDHYEKSIGSVHPLLLRASQLLHVFPALVVPIELRESSDVLLEGVKPGKRLAIERMLRVVAKISRGGDPRWYTRGFIISMANSIEHIQAAAKLQMRVFGALRIPIIPLFEEASSLVSSEKIMTAMLKDLKLRKAIRENWNGLVEMMVGYSDSAKESGVLPSRLAIAEALPKLERVCENARVTPIFFHGSGGSVDRGGGSIEDQISWWPKSALRWYKVTVQGEMVERSLATPAIAKGQLNKIVQGASVGLAQQKNFSKDPVLEDFGKKVSTFYRNKISSPDFLEVVEASTPYAFLDVFRIGSRPIKRAGQLQVQGLRAIPWVLCWTQTRVLFPTWWGIGSAWETETAQKKLQLKRAFQKDAVFRSYIKALGFTLAKVELAVWRVYLENSKLSPARRSETFREFENEFEKTLTCYRDICEQTELMWYRPWLAESILLRSAMIHPLNLLQILGHKDHDVALLRLTMAGISSGMLTTG